MANSGVCDPGSLGAVGRTLEARFALRTSVGLIVRERPCCDLFGTDPDDAAVRSADGLVGMLTAPWILDSLADSVAEAGFRKSNVAEGDRTGGWKDCVLSHRLFSPAELLLEPSPIDGAKLIRGWFLGLETLRLRVVSPLLSANAGVLFRIEPVPICEERLDGSTPGPIDFRGCRTGGAFDAGGGNWLWRRVRTVGGGPIPLFAADAVEN